MLGESDESDESDEADIYRAEEWPHSSLLVGQPVSIFITQPAILTRSVRCVLPTNYIWEAHRLRNLAEPGKLFEPVVVLMG
jgi:hypothetical protein